ncbi:T9SS type A sorting domain-containing protein [Candidatus Latescibacterota bacterium]
MWNRNNTLVIAMIATLCTIFSTQYLFAQNKINSPNMPIVDASGKRIGEFLTPDGHFDMEAARRTGFQNSLDMKGYKSKIDITAGQPVFRPTVSASTAEEPDDIYWDNSMSSSISRVDSLVIALTTYDGKLIAGGWFTTAGGIDANRIAAWDGFSWSSLGSGLNDTVETLSVYDGKLIAGGKFTSAGKVKANRIAAWDGLSWSPLGSGMNIFVNALTVYDGKLIAGGFFTTAGGIDANRIAAWDGSSWSPLGSGMNGYVSDLTVYNGKLIAGGMFTTAGGIDANRIAAWDGSSWSPLGSGIDRSYFDPQINALTVYDGKLITGGNLFPAGGESANNIPAWNGTSWSPIGSGLGGTVSALTVYNGILIAGGYFTTADGVEVNRITAWDGLSWSPLGSGISDVVLPDVYVQTYVEALTVYDEELIVGGKFTVAGGKDAPHIAKWTKKDSPDEVERSSLPTTVKLSLNYPNPFNPATTIGYDVPSQSRIIITIYSVLGQPVRTLVDDTREAGSYRVTWDGTDRFGTPVSMGVYFYRIQAGHYSETKKMLLLK